MSKNMIGDFQYKVLRQVEAMNGEAYTVTIADGIAEDRGKRVWLGPVHATLSRLESKKMVTSKLRPGGPERGGRKKRVYKLTALGRKALAARKAEALRIYGEDDGESAPK